MRNEPKIGTKAPVKTGGTGGVLVQSWTSGSQQYIGEPICVAQPRSQP